MNSHILTQREMDVALGLSMQRPSLSSVYGYRFEYAQNSVSKDEENEVEMALLRVAAKIDAFLKIAHLDASDERILSLAASIKAALPNSKCGEHQMMIFSKVLAMLERLLKQNPNANAATEQANKLLRRFINLQNQFAFYA